MKRKAYEDLLIWKNKSNRKPLIVQGARQVGKTWLLEEFGKREFESVAQINFEKSTQLAGIFETDFDVERIMRSIQLITGIKPVAGETLIIFDEIQSVKRGLLSLKYLHDAAPEYHIVAAGSLLGISLHAGDSFPVGKVEFMDLYPLSFEEFMMAMGQEALLETILSGDYTLVSAFRDKYIELLKQYYYVGGMPEVVQEFALNGDFKQVRSIQNDILRSYDNDFSKHPPLDVIPRLKMVWNNIPSQLSRENKKFVFGAVKQGSRAKDFELAIAWLQDAGVIHKITRISNASLPLKGFEDINAFKLYMVDVGLLCAMSGLDAATIVDGNAIFTQYKGALTEQFVLQQLLCVKDITIHYWTPDAGMAEVDFVVQLAGKIIPIEVKAEENLKAKSLKSYCDKYKPQEAIRTSMSNYRKEENFTNLPLYAIFMLERGV